MRSLGQQRAAQSRRRRCGRPHQAALPRPHRATRPRGVAFAAAGNDSSSRSISPARTTALFDAGAAAAASVPPAAGKPYSPAAQPHSQPPAPPPPPPADVTIFYETGWRSGLVHGSLAGGEWRDYPLERVASAPGKWLRARIPVAAAAATADAATPPPPLLEFVVTDGGGAWDKPPEGGNYLLPSPGTYTLRGGRLERADGPRACIVSDLDGTMVGDDGATAEFKRWWESSGAPRGGCLVYNTGRSLESFQALLSDKAHCLARPDALISAVGTKIYGYAGGGRWEEDPGWSARLDEAWDLGAVRDAAYKALAEVGREAMHFRPPEEQNGHKVTCGVRAESLARVLESVEASLGGGSISADIGGGGSSTSGSTSSNSSSSSMMNSSSSSSSGNGGGGGNSVEARAIVSGTGEWRFLDLVPRRAGKLEALEYLCGSVHGFGPSETVACGDSGNDILMLSGRNLAVVVGNAQPDLVAWLEGGGGGGGDNGDDGPVPGKRRLFRSEAHEARGILEALEYFGLK